MGKPITTPEELLAAKMMLVESMDNGSITLEELRIKLDALDGSFTPPAAPAITLKEAVSILKKHNIWRRGDGDLAMTEPRILGKAIDIIVDYLEKQNASL